METNLEYACAQFNDSVFQQYNNHKFVFSYLWAHRQCGFATQFCYFGCCCFFSLVFLRFAAHLSEDEEKKNKRGIGNEAETEIR